MIDKFLITSMILNLLGCVTVSKLDSNIWLELIENESVGGLAMPNCHANQQLFFVHGGISDQGVFSRFNSRSDVLNLETNSWQAVNPVDEPEPKSDQVAAGYRDEVVVFGGGSETHDFTSNAHIYTIGNNTWIRHEQTGIEPRIRHKAIVVDGKFIVFGGEGEKEDLNWGTYDFEEKRWLAFDLPSGFVNRIYFVAEALGNDLLIWGGFENRQKTSSGFLLNPNDQTTTPLPLNNAPSPRSNARSVSFGDKILIWGGSTIDGNSNSGAVFSRKSFKWTTLPVIPDPRYQTLKNPSLSALKNRYALLWGGRFGSEEFNNEGWLFDIKKWRWSRLQQANPPAARMLHCMMNVSDQELILFGGVGTNEDSFIHFSTPFRIVIGHFD